MDKLISIFNKRILIFIIITCIFTGFIMPVEAEEIYFTQEEKDYLAKGIVLKAASIEGGAPLHNRDSKYEIKGIAVNVLNEISYITGIVFEYYLYKSIDDALNSKPDIAFGMTKEYVPPGMALSKPYLESETILFYNKSIDPKQLENKRYAAIQSGTLPKGIKEEQTIYFNARKDTIDAVESGKADFGFGNAYSLAFYTLQNGYKNIITVPVGKEERAYCIGVQKGDETLLSIINKSIEAIDENRMDTLVLDIASQIERKITFPMIINAYGKEIFSLVFLMIVILIYSVFLNTRAKNQFKIENKRYKILSHISNECLFEYQIKSDNLKISEKFIEKIDVYKRGVEVTELLKEAIRDSDNDSPDENIYTIKLPLSNGDTGVFKIISSYLKDESGKIYSIIGKLMDISEEEKERKQLIAKSQLDGLTGLYNHTSTREAIIKSINDKDKNKIDSLIIIDCDNFKDINDNYGHLKGDLALKNISEGLKLTFRKTDIIGRIGGDEFCVYMHDIPSVDFVCLKCKQLVYNIQKLNEEFQINVSIGIAILKEQSTYESLFKRADQALYHAKANGRSQIVIYGEGSGMEFSVCQ